MEFAPKSRNARKKGNRLGRPLRKDIAILDDHLTRMGAYKNPVLPCASLYPPNLAFSSARTYAKHSPT